MEFPALLCFGKRTALSLMGVRIQPLVLLCLEKRTPMGVRIRLPVSLRFEKRTSLSLMGVTAWPPVGLRFEQDALPLIQAPRLQVPKLIVEAQHTALLALGFGQLHQRHAPSSLLP
jgi:hypothetical protein